MKIIKYKIMTEINHGTEENPDIVQTFHVGEIQCSDANFDSNYAIAQAEAYNGEVTVEEVSGEEPEPADDLETRVATVETDLADLTAAVEKGLSL